MKKRLVNGSLEVPEGMSKKAFKRELKRKKMEDDHEKFIETRRTKRRELRVRQRDRRRAAIAASDATTRPRRLPEDPEIHDIEIVFDCAFDDLMKGGEMLSLSRQLELCYASNRKSLDQVRLVFASVDGRLDERLKEAYKGHHLRWHNTVVTEAPFTKSDKMIYLSSDSPDVLTELHEGYTYIIGGIVDKGRYKNLCYDKAVQMGIPTARIPIDEHIKVSGRRVLTTNHVFEILLKWLELRDWRLAFEAILPMRKLIEGSKSPESSVEPSPAPENI